MRRSECRSCHAAIIWTVDRTTGRLQPLDADPHPDGNIELTGATVHTSKRGTIPQSAVVGRQETLFDPPERRLNHFVTCPDATEWAKPAAERPA